MTFTAKYSGTCSDCGEKIRSGDTANYVDGELVHDTCPDIRPAKTSEVCPKCFIQRPCACEDGQ